MSAARGLGTLFVSTRAAEEVLDRVVALVALDAEKRRVDRPERPLGGPRSRPGVRIFHRHPVPKRLRADAGEALDDVETFAGVEVVRVATKVGGVDDERLAFVMSDRIPEPAPDGGCAVRA